MSDFDKETKALRDAVHGKPVKYGDISKNLTYEKGETGSANHKLGSNPAWWLDCQRRGDSATVAKGLDWSDWYAREAHLYENESGTLSPAYRVRMDCGTYALAMFAEFAGQTTLRNDLLKKCRYSVALALFGAFPHGSARKLVNNNPQPADVATLLVADGALVPLAGDEDGNVPYIAAAGMRSLVRDGATHSGPIKYMDDPHLRVLVAQALGYKYKKVTNSTQVDIFDTVKSRSGLAPWGLSVVDMTNGRKFLDNKLDLTLAGEILKWMQGVPGPKLPYAILQRDSGIVEFVQLLSQNSSTGAKQCEVVMPDGTRYIGSADNGKRGGSVSGSKNIQKQEAVEHESKWVCRWLSGEGEVVEVPRPAKTDKVRWRVNIKDGNAVLVVLIPPTTEPPPVEPPVEPPVVGGTGPLVYLGPGAPGEHLYGAGEEWTIREIHGDPASGYPKRWIVE